MVPEWALVVAAEGTNGAGFADPAPVWGAEVA